MWPLLAHLAPGQRACTAVHFLHAVGCRLARRTLFRYVEQVIRCAFVWFAWGDISLAGSLGVGGVHTSCAMAHTHAACTAQKPQPRWLRTFGQPPIKTLYHFLAPVFIVLCLPTHVHRPWPRHAPSPPCARAIFFCTLSVLQRTPGPMLMSLLNSFALLASVPCPSHAQCSPLGGQAGVAFIGPARPAFAVFSCEQEPFHRAGCACHVGSLLLLRDQLGCVPAGAKRACQPCNTTSLALRSHVLTLHALLLCHFFPICCNYRCTKHRASRAPKITPLPACTTRRLGAECALASKLARPPSAASAAGRELLAQSLR